MPYANAAAPLSARNGATRLRYNQRRNFRDVTAALMSALQSTVLRRNDVLLPYHPNSDVHQLCEMNKHVFDVRHNVSACDVPSREYDRRTLASVWLPSESLRANAVFLSDARDDTDSCVHNMFTTLLVYFANLLFSAEHVNDQCHIRVSFWYRDGAAQRAPTIRSNNASDVFSTLYAGASLSLVQRGTRDSVAKNSEISDDSIKSTCDMIDMQMKTSSSRDDTATSLRSQRRKRRRVSRRKASASVRGIASLESIVHEHHMTLSDAVRVYAQRLDDTRVTECVRHGGLYELLASSTSAALRCKCVRDEHEVSHICAATFALPVDRSQLSSVNSTVLPHVGIPIVNFAARIAEALDKHMPAATSTRHNRNPLHRHLSIDDNAPTLETTATSSSSSSSSDAVSEQPPSIVTNERRIRTLRRRLDELMWNTCDWPKCGEALRELERAQRRFLFDMYTSLCRGGDERNARVAECFHQARIRDKIDVLQKRTLSRYGSPMVNGVTTALSCYDWYRSAVMRDLVQVAAARPDIVALVQFFLENATCAYNYDIEEMCHLVMMGASGCGKDFVLRLVEDVMVDGVVQKVSRATKRADAVECRGRDDGLILYNPEISTENIHKSRARGGAGDTITKDRQSSGRVVTRCFRYDDNGRRTNVDIVNEQYVLEYYALNISSISALDKALFQRSLWIWMPPPTDATQCAILTSVYLNSNDRQRKSSQSYLSLIRCQRFLQLASYEVHLMSALGCIAGVVTEAAEVILIYVMRQLIDKRPVYGCTASVFRRYRQVRSLAREHCIRRTVVDAFLSSRGEFYEKQMTPQRLASLKYYVTVCDLALALGQTVEHMGIFRHGEIQIIMALRYLWITNKYRHVMFGDEVGSLNAFQSYFGGSEPSPRYVRFKGTITSIARECVNVLLRVCPRERGAPRPISLEMAVDALKRMTCSSNDDDPPPTVTLEDDCLKFTREFGEILESLRRPKDRGTTTQAMSNGDARAHARDIAVEFNSCDTLTPVLCVDDARKRGMEHDDTAQPPCAIIRRGNHAIDVHVCYLTRLFDPRKRFWPFTSHKPKSWSPEINEHTLVMDCLERLRSYKCQNFPVRVMYRMQHGTKSRAAASSTSSSSRSEIDVDYITRKHSINTRYMRIEVPRSEDDGCDEGVDTVELHAPLDAVARYATEVGWEHAVYAASSTKRWKRAIENA